MKNRQILLFSILIAVAMLGMIFIFFYRRTSASIKYNLFHSRRGHRIFIMKSIFQISSYLV